MEQLLQIYVCHLFSRHSGSCETIHCNGFTAPIIDGGLQVRYSGQSFLRPTQFTSRVSGVNHHSVNIHRKSTEHSTSIPPDLPTPHLLDSNIEQRTPRWLRGWQLGKWSGVCGAGRGGAQTGGACRMRCREIFFSSVGAFGQAGIWD